MIFSTSGPLRAAARGLAALFLAAMTALACIPAGAQELQPIRMVIPFGPGSGTDIYARLLAQQLGAQLGTPVVVDNRPGANGVLACDIVQHAKPDGTTLLFTTNTTHAANPHLVKDLRYDPVRDFAPVSKLGNLSFFVIVPASSPFDSMAALIEGARRKPGSVSYGVANSVGIVSGSKLAKTAGVDLLQVPYKSSPQIITDLLGGQVSFAFVDLAAAAPLIKSGKVRALAVLADKRFPTMPTVPSMREVGFPDFDVVAWFGMFAPAGTPPAFVNRVSKALNAIVAQPEVRQQTQALGLDVFASTPEELGDYVRSQIALWGKLTADAGLKPE
jgi:tripartite-type tricarboxylate transporter receptor subunit TctC